MVREIKDYGLPMMQTDPRYIDWGRLEMESGDSTGWDWNWHKFAKAFYNWQSQTTTMTEVVAEYDRVCASCPLPAPTEHTRQRIAPLVEDMRAELAELHQEPEGGFSQEARALAQEIVDMGGTEEQALRAAHERHSWQPAPAPSREALEAVWREGDFVDE